MKGLLILLLFIITDELSAQELPGLIGHWKMDNTCELTDESDANPANGVLLDISSASNMDNVPNAAILFNAGTSYITFGAVDKLKLAEDKSISFLIKPVLTGSNHTGSIFNYGTGINIRYQEVGGVARIVIIFGNVTYLQANLVADQWQSVIITFKKDYTSTKSKVGFYLNGVQAAESEQNKSAHDFNNSIAIIGPANQTTLTNGFRGSLDNMKVYNRTLTSEEIFNLALPVTLEFFKAKKVNGSVELTWKTEAEENVSHFEVEKSVDGIIFKRISIIDAGKYNYVFIDQSGISGIVWYHLRIVDRDGKNTFSGVIKINGDNLPVSEGSGLRLFPNPGSGYVTVTGARGGSMITIINSTGAVIKQKQLTANGTLDMSGLMPGFYYIQFIDGTQKMTSKFNKR